MKIRLGFVSNSSSSSFTCDVCGSTESGMDLCLGEAEMFQCANGHTVCEVHGKEIDFNAIPWQDQKAILLNIVYGDARKLLGAVPDEAGFRSFLAAMEIEDFGKYVESEWRYQAPPGMCPICQFEKALPADLLRYVLMKHGVTADEVLAQTKAEYGDYASFKESLK